MSKGTDLNIRNSRFLARMYKPLSFSVSIEERFSTSKTGKQEDCEDLIHDRSQHFVAVIDGVTSKTDKKWNGETGGRVAARIINRAFAQMPQDYTAYQAVDLMTVMIAEYYEKFDCIKTAEANPTQRIAASFVAISLCKNEIWSVGDCQFMLGNQTYSSRISVDQIMSGVRALFLELEILKGATIDELCAHDTGRDFILPLLKTQSFLQNNPKAGEYWYPVVDGFSVPREGIVVKAIPEEVDTIVLASDGYPVLRNNLEESESLLKDILEKDPLLFREYKATKGKSKGNVSFDDRAFVKVRIIA